jgi:hypothetical protein
MVALTVDRRIVLPMMIAANSHHMARTVAAPRNFALL